MTSEEKKEILKVIRQDIKSGKHINAFSRLNEISDKCDDFVLQTKYADFFNAISGKLSGLNKIRVAILATSTVTHFISVLKYWLAKEGLDADIFEGEYNTIHQTILDPSSSLYGFNPHIVMLFNNYRDVNFPPPKDNSFEEVHKAVHSAVTAYTSLWDALWKNSKCFIIQNNADLPTHRVFGNYEGNISWSYINMLRHFNLELAQVAKQECTIFDLDYISSVYGKGKWHEPRYWYYSKHAFALDATGFVAYETAKVISAIKGLAKKCIIMDLDNTLWGGIIGDDGIEGIKLGNGPDGEAFVDFQKFILQLKNRGIILAVCSKNDESLAKEPFLHHPDMQIKLDDIAVFQANWDDKVNNIKDIANHLNIGLDSMVFIDDNPAERELVRKFLPMVSVPELPADPAGFTASLSIESFFETVTFSDEDKMRNQFYRDNAARSKHQQEFTDITEYLKNLDMVMSVSEITEFNLPRATQLINKSNQFHLTTTRHAASELKALQQDKNHICLCFNLTDCFGDNGLISMVILKKNKDKTLHVETWVMSCRVLSRTVEEFIIKTVIDTAKDNGCERIIGKYIPTKRNKLVKNLYKRLRFSLKEENSGNTLWELFLDKDIPNYKTFIKKIDQAVMV